MLCKTGTDIGEITKSSREQMVPVGLISRDTLLELTDKSYRYRRENGQERQGSVIFLAGVGLCASLLSESHGEKSKPYNRPLASVNA